MCMPCVLRDAETTDGGASVRRKIETGMRCGKSKNTFNSLLRQGCPTGKKRCGMCGHQNGGKSSRKGKGKQQHNPFSDF